MKLVSVKQTPASSKKKLIAIFDDGMKIQSWLKLIIKKIS